MSIQDTFNHLMLIETCKQDKYLKNADLQNLTLETLTHLVNHKYTSELKVLPLKLGRTVLKYGLSILEESFPNVKKYLNSKTISSEPRLDEILYLSNNNNAFLFKPSLPLIVAKNLVIELFGSQLVSISNDILEKAAKLNLNDGLNKDVKIPVKNVEPNKIEISSKDTYSDVFDSKPNLKRHSYESVETDVPNKQLKLEKDLKSLSREEQIEIISDERLDRESQYIIETLNEPIEDVESNSDITFGNTNIQYTTSIDSSVEINQICNAVTDLENFDNSIYNNISTENAKSNGIGNVSSIYKLHGKDCDEDNKQFDGDDKLNASEKETLLTNNVTNDSDFESILEKNIKKIHNVNSNLSENFLENFEKLVKPEEIKYTDGLDLEDSDIDDNFVEDLDSDDEF